MSPTRSNIPDKKDKKPNCTNTLYKFYLPDVEYVTKLNFYNPDKISNNTLYNLKKSTAVEKQKEEATVFTKLRGSKIFYI